jgi:molybdopterin converting factor small subunit
VVEEGRRLIRVKVVFLGILADITGRSIEILDIPENTSVDSLIAILSEKHSSLFDWLSKVPLIQVSVNGVDVTSRDVTLHNGDEVVLSTPLYEGG